MKKALIVTAVILICGFAETGDYYVSLKGNDSNFGVSAEKAFGSISGALESAKAGDTINISPGIYYDKLRIKASGTKEAPIKIKKAGTGELVLTMKEPEPKDWLQRFSVIVKNSEYIEFEGITFKDCSAWFYMENVRNVLIKDCVFDGCTMYNGTQFSACSYIKFTNCDFKKATTLKEFEKNQYVYYPAPGADYIEFFRDSHHNIVENCRFGKINHVGVLIEPFRQNEKRPAYNIVRNNVFTDSLWKSMGIHNSDYTLVENNIFRGKTKNFIQMESHSIILRKNLFIHQRDIADIGGYSEEQFKAALLLKSGINDKVECNVKDNRIYNNLFFDNEWTTGCYSTSKPVLNNIFKNNIFYKNKQTIFFPWVDYATANKNYMFNNIMEGKAAGEKLIKLNKDSFTLSEVQARLPDIYKNNMEGDPKFTDSEKDIYTLKPDSPCIDRGTALTFAVTGGSGKDIKVDDALYFSDGYGLIDGDMIIVGNNTPVKITKVNHDTKTLSVEKEIRWNSKDSVNLSYTGKGPDIGPFEYESK